MSSCAKLGVNPFWIRCDREFSWTGCAAVRALFVCPTGEHSVASDARLSQCPLFCVLALSLSVFRHLDAASESDACESLSSALRFSAALSLSVLCWPQVAVEALCRCSPNSLPSSKVAHPAQRRAAAVLPRLLQCTSSCSTLRPCLAPAV